MIHSRDVTQIFLQDRLEILESLNCPTSSSQVTGYRAIRYGMVPGNSPAGRGGFQLPGLCWLISANIVLGLDQSDKLYSHLGDCTGTSMKEFVDYINHSSKTYSK